MKTRNFKKVLSMVLVLMMVISTMAILPMTASAEDEPAPVVTLKGKGTSGDPYLIGSYEELAALKAKADEMVTAEAPVGTPMYVKLTADITMTSALMLNDDGYGGKTGKFLWNIDGDNHKIINATAPLFRSWGDAAGVQTVKNLHFVNAQITYAKNVVGAVVCNAYGGWIENVTVDEQSVIKSSATDGNVKAGAIVGCVVRNDVVIADCVNNGTVMGDYAGGIVGKLGHYGVEQIYSQDVRNCVNNGTVTGVKAAGGIVAENEASSNGDTMKGTLTVQNCVNKGTVTATGTDAFAGALLGYTSRKVNANYTAITIKNSYSTTGTALAGSIMTAPDATDGAPAPVECVTLTGCFDATAAADATNAEAIAKINAFVAEPLYFAISTFEDLAALKAESEEMLPGTRLNVDFMADITIPEAQASSFRMNNSIYAGDANALLRWNIDGNGYTITGLTRSLFRGLNGHAAGGTITIKNLNLNSQITDDAERYVGGFVTSAYAPFVIENCTMNGTVTNKVNSGASIVGGLVGYLIEWDGFVMRNCVNNATVSMPVSNTNDNMHAGGLVGKMGHWDGGSLTHLIENCVNNGTVTGGRNAGGIVGNVNPEEYVVDSGSIDYTAMIRNCKNNGAVTSTSSGAKLGSIVGATTVNADCGEGPKNVKIENCASTVPGLVLVGYTSEFATLTVTNSTVTHLYDNACDTACNTCGETRTVGEHVYDNDCDIYCNECFAERATEHVYDNACDTKCNVCDEERTTEHTYDNACDAKCNVCDAERTPAAHKYTNDADTTCDVCGATRTVETKAPETTTAAPETTAPVEEKGCGGALNSTYAVIALVSVLGFALVAKKREEN